MLILPAGFFGQVGDRLSHINWAARFQNVPGFGSSARQPQGFFQDVSCTIPAVANGDPVAARKDPDSGVIISQGDGTAQPLLGGVSTGAYCIFDGSNDNYTSSFPIPSGDFSFFCLAKLTSVAAFPMLMTWSGSSDSLELRYDNGGAKPQFEPNGGAVTASASRLNAWTMLTVIGTEGACELFVNGASQGSVSDTSTRTGVLGVGCRTATVNFFFPGNIASLGIVNSAVSPSDRALVESVWPALV